MKVLCYGMALLSITACKEDEYLVDESSEKIISANIEAPLLFGEEEVTKVECLGCKKDNYRRT